MKHALFCLCTCLVAILGVFGCGGSGGSEGSGSLRIFMADAPLPDVSSLVIRIDKIEAHVDGDWRTVAAAPQDVDLLLLKNQAMVTAESGLPAGHINQVRLFVSSAVVTDSTGTYDVDIPSNLQTGIKVNIDATIEPNTLTAILLDFNVEKSLRKLGNGSYLLQPVIPAVLVEEAGTITGTVTLNSLPVHGALVRAVYAAGSHYPIGTEVNTSTTSADGTFKVWALREGTYTLEVTFTDSVPSNFVATVTNVDVVAGSNTDVGTVVLLPAP